MTFDCFSYNIGVSYRYNFIFLGRVIAPVFDHASMAAHFIMEIQLSS